MQRSNKDETYFYCDKNPKLNYIPQFFDLIFVIFHVSNKAYLPKMKHIQSLNLLRWLRNFACLIIQKEIEDVSRNLHFFHKSYLKLLVINSPKFSANFIGIISADKKTWIYRSLSVSADTKKSLSVAHYIYIKEPLIQLL